MALLLGLRRINAAVSSVSQRVRLYGLAVLGYGVFAAVIFFALPANPDPVEVPIDLLELFRTLTMIGQFLLWTLLALGVGLAVAWYERAAQKRRSPGLAPDPLSVTRREVQEERR
jgi:hypothetical protein